MRPFWLYLANFLFILIVLYLIWRSVGTSRLFRGGGISIWSTTKQKIILRHLEFISDSSSRLWIPVGARDMSLLQNAYPALRPTQPHIEWVPGILSRGMKRPERDVDQSHPFRAEIKSKWGYTSIPPIHMPQRSLQWQLYTLEPLMWAENTKFNLNHLISSTHETCGRTDFISFFTDVHYLRSSCSKNTF